MEKRRRKGRREGRDGKKEGERGTMEENRRIRGRQMEGGREGGMGWKGKRRREGGM